MNCGVIGVLVMFYLVFRAHIIMDIIGFAKIYHDIQLT